MKIYNQTRKELNAWTDSIKNKWKYGTSIPSRKKTIWIDPEKVDYKLIPYFTRDVPLTSHSYVIGGKWDIRYENENKIFPQDYEGTPKKRRLVRIKNLDQYQSFYSHFKQGVPWEETKFYQRRINEGFDTGRYSSRSGFHRRLKYIDDLYNNIKESGYKSQKEVRKGNQGFLSHGYWAHEIQVDIGREGEIFLDDGRNRFIIANLLDIDKIPVHVLVRHKRWQGYRRRVGKASTVKSPQSTDDELINHPDMQDLI